MYKEFKPARRSGWQAPSGRFDLPGRTTLSALLVATFFCAPALAASSPTDPSPPIVVTGNVPDESSRVVLLARLREVFGSDRVVDNLSVGGVVAPANWSSYAAKIVSPELKSVTRGQLSLDGTNLIISGQVDSEAVRQQIASNLATSLNPNYVVKNGLLISPPQQSLLDKVLAGRTIEFESGSANLTPSGMLIVDEMAAAMKALGDKKYRIVGHTDNQGGRIQNLALSLIRAKVVRNYLASKGIDTASIVTQGTGPDSPVASNATESGRARNRRIEFLID